MRTDKAEEATKTPREVHEALQKRMHRRSLKLLLDEEVT